MSRKVFKYSSVIASLLLTAVFAGCGTSNKEGSDPSAVADVPKVSESACAQCHGASVDHVTGDNIYKDYIASSHFTNNFRLVGCQDCHGGGSQHNGVGPLPYPDPSAAGKCFDCHKPAFLGNYEATKVATAVEKAHFYNMTASQLDPDNFAPAVYVSANYQKSCTSCHDPHKGNNGVGQEHKDWAESGHGNVNNHAWADEDFKENASCIRCHTATGFIDYVSSGYTLPTTTWAKAGDTTREVVTCKACHTDYNFKNRVRNAGAFTAPYNSGKNPQKFPSVGATNLCIPCHAGRESGDTVKGVSDFSNSSFKNSHYLAAAGLMYMKAGFTGFTSASAAIGTSTYGKTLTPDSTSTPDGISGGVSSTHRKLGTSLINGDSHNTAFFVAGNLDSDGPCVVCHLNGASSSAPSRASSHTLAINADAFDQVCVKCHDDEAGTPLTGANFKTVFLDPQAEVFQNALDLAVSILQTNYNIKYDENTYPYFYDLAKDAAGKTAVKDWTRGTKNQQYGMKVMGACFNINLLKKEPAAYVHARTYVRRLVYDTIDFLDDGAINLSAGNTAIALNPALYGKGAKAYTTSATVGDVAPGTTESMLYLLGYNRSNGNWSTPERP